LFGPPGKRKTDRCNGIYKIYIAQKRKPPQGGKEREDAHGGGVGCGGKQGQIGWGAGVAKRKEDKKSSPGGALLQQR